MKKQLPKYIADSLIGLSKADLDISYFRSSGPGGQHRNKTDTACRIKHRETGITAEASDSRSQATNRQNAFKKLVDRLIEHYRKPSAARERNSGWAEKIRTYHFPRGTVKDHRTGKDAALDKVLDGDIDLLK